MRILAIGAALLALVGCSSSSTSGGVFTIDGSWLGRLNATNVQHVAQMIANFIADSTGGNTDTGTVSIPSSLGCWTGGTLTAVVTGDSVTITIMDANGTTIALTGTVSRSRMSGVFSSSGGVPGGTDTGGGGGGDTTAPDTAESEPTEEPTSGSLVRQSTVCGNLTGTWVLNRS